MAKTGWHTGMWHTMIKVPQDNVADYKHPSPMVDLFGTTIVIDISNVRCFCKYCKDVEYIKATCNQGQHVQACKNEINWTFQQPHPHQQQRPAPTTCTTNDGMDDVAHTLAVDMTSSSPQTMEYEPSYMAYVGTPTSNDAWKPGEILTIAQLQAFLQQYRAAAHPDSTDTHSTASAQGGHCSVW
jgi:hypothetical protein